MKKSEEYALKVSGLREIPDEEDRYYKSYECKIYDAVKNTYEDIEKETTNKIIEKAIDWLKMHININADVETTENGEPLADSYIKYATERAKVAQEIINDFYKSMSE